MDRLMFEAIWSWITSNTTALGVLLSAAPPLGAIIQYILNKRSEANRQQFETYHSLIKQLVEREDPTQPMRLDRQIAVVYELKNFKRYFPVTLRILRGLKIDWVDYGPIDKRTRLLDELEIAIDFISKKV
jgi:hypothetical protein